MADDDKVYVKFVMNKGRPLSRFVFGGERESVESSDPSKPDDDENGATDSDEDGDFKRSVFQRIVDDFMDKNQIIRDTVPLMMQMMLTFRDISVEKNLYDFAKEAGCLEVEKDEYHLISFPSSDLPEFMKKVEEFGTMVRGIGSLPPMFLIGLVSSYDEFFSDLLRTVIRLKPSISAEKTFTLSMLLAADSVESARTQLIEKEVDEIMRKSHQDQLKWLDEQLKLKTFKYKRFSNLIEMFERRNLHTHTSGKVSSQYLRVCSSQNHDVGDAKLGDLLTVSPDYFRECVGVVLEFGIILTQKVWRALIPDERESAVRSLNHVGFQLLKADRPKIAAQLLQFAYEENTYKGTDKSRKMVIVNWANAEKLCGNEKLVKEILAKEDWSAAPLKYQICLAAVKGDDEAVIALLRPSVRGGEITKHMIDDWPAFETIRSNQQFMQEYEDVFGERLLLPGSKPKAVTIAEGDANTPSSEG